MRIEKIQLYPARPDVTLTCYLHENADAAVADIVRPAIVICPGGAYLNCSPREGEPVALRFAAMGYHTFVLRYSTYSGQSNFFVEPGHMLEPKPERQFPAALRDLGLAFLVLGEHAEEWNLDMDRVAICGFSAGAHNCAMYSVYWNSQLLTDHFGKPAEAFRPAAAILGYGFSDYRLMLRNDSDPGMATLSINCNLAFLGVETPDAVLLDTASPVLHVGRHTPPTFIWGTAADPLVPTENSAIYAAACARAGVPFEIHIFEEGIHGLSLADQATADCLMSVEPDAAKWVELCECWLKKRFALTLPKSSVWMEILKQS